MTPASPTKIDFAPHVGKTFTVSGEAGNGMLQLAAVEDIANSPRPDGGFCLDFTAPAAEGPLPQAIYRFACAEKAWDIFIVPVGRDGDTIRYEAIFN